MQRPIERGFTIVELIIVIIVIAILATITLVVYSGVEGRARDNVRYNDVKNIRDALEVYRSQNGHFPPTDASPVACSTTNYSMSVATDGSWLHTLISGKYIDVPVGQTGPKPPTNNCDHYYRYRYVDVGETSYGCPLTSNFYVLQVIGTDNALNPDDALKVAPSQCTSFPSDWISTSNKWTFISFENP